VLTLLLLIAAATVSVTGFNAGLSGRISRWRTTLLILVLAAIMLVYTRIPRPSFSLSRGPCGTLSWAHPTRTRGAWPFVWREMTTVPWQVLSATRVVGGDSIPHPLDRRHTRQMKWQSRRWKRWLRMCRLFRPHAGMA
jgi:hypothetical protein